MKVGIIGIGEMGFPMAGHIRDKGFALTVYDVDEARLNAAKDNGFDTASSLAELATKAEIFIAVVALHLVGQSSSRMEIFDRINPRMLGQIFSACLN